MKVIIHLILYDVIGNHDFTERDTFYQPRPHQPRPDPIYSQINMRGMGPRGQMDFITTRTPLPPQNFQNLPGAIDERPDDFRGQQGGQDYRLARNQNGRAPDNMHAIRNSPPQARHQPPPPPQPVKEEKKIGWACSTCTFLNNPHRPGCEQCGTARPANYVVPVDAPVDEATLKAEESERLFQEVRMYVCMCMVYGQQIATINILDLV